MIIRDWLQTFGKTATYPHKTNALKVCKSEMCMLKKSMIVQSSDDNEGLQISAKTTTYPHGTKAFKVCESEM